LSRCPLSPFLFVATSFGVNVGNLLLARTNERIKEVGVRIALGAPRARLIAQTALENAMLCAAGGVLVVSVLPYSA